jgi:ribosomal protein L11 methyltransferase
VHYKPVRIGRQICVRPEWCASEAGPDDLENHPRSGHAFGTGTHPSTQLCLIALEDLPSPPAPLAGWTSAAGSGILAIAAAKLGAEHLWALDIDQLAVDATLRNAGLNAVSDRLTASRAPGRAAGFRTHLRADSGQHHGQDDHPDVRARLGALSRAGWRWRSSAA